ncbi:cholecystokinin receptor type A-like [Babylonia areolata]|uniref:cholecystokinin receptor type A-like n=1 Tax=Babylonia areolata TaxID=304850 RepID=UPI003FD46178
METTSTSTSTFVGLVSPEEMAANGTESDVISNITGHLILSPTELYSLVGILSVFSVTGTIGNAIAFYVFSTLKKQKLTSTIFILALAGTDFITCLVTIPFTITMELLNFRLQVDFLCKLYHFLITTTVPFSAFVMVVIAVDRYLCICHPFMHWMTQRRAKIIIACLAFFIFCIGAVISMHYSIYTDNEVDLSQEYTGVANDQCDRRPNLVNVQFFSSLQKIYSSFFLISCVAVLILYSLIYHSVVTQRRKKLKIRNARCCYLWRDSSGVANGEPSEVTAALELSHINGDNTKIRPDDFTTTGVGGGGGGGGDDASSGVPTNGSSRAPLSRTRIERMRMANIKTALMLFVVTIVFILSFLPSWLIALKIIEAPVLVFYMYFFYNVVNPIIYAFMNQNFRTELKKLFRCCK